MISHFTYRNIHGANGPCRARMRMNREPLPRQIVLRLGSTEASVDDMMAGSPLRDLVSRAGLSPVSQSMCPHLRDSEFRCDCEVYLGPQTEPSLHEQGCYCRTRLHSGCAWYLSKETEVTGEITILSPSAPVRAGQIPDVFSRAKDGIERECP